MTTGRINQVQACLTRDICAISRAHRGAAGASYDSMSCLWNVESAMDQHLSWLSNGARDGHTLGRRCRRGSTAGYEEDPEP